MSFKDKIAIIGAGCTKFGENFNKSYSDMVFEAAQEAFQDGGVESKDIDAAWLGTAFPDAGVYKGRSGMDLAEPLAMFDIPISRVSNYCATGGDAFRNGCNSLLSGESDVVLALGAEKLRDRTPQDSIVKMMVDTGHPICQKGFTAAGTFAVVGTRYMHVYGDIREHLSKIAVKNHYHGSLNPKAHYQKPITLEYAMKSPMVAFPVNLMGSCPTTDGSAAVVMTRAEDAKKYTDDYVLLKGYALSISTGWDLPFYDPDYDFLGWRATQIAGEKACKQAGIEDPFKELDLAEVHDCFSIVEFITYEDLKLCKKGKARELIDSEATTLGGELPVNVSGGLLSSGHPIGATGIRMLYELCLHLRGRADKRQVKDARLGLAHNIGGPGAVSSVTILGAR